MSDHDSPELKHAMARDWLGVLARYKAHDTVRSTFELAITIVALAGLWIAAWAALSVGYWLTLLLAVPAAVFLVRLFLIQHDCGHGALYRDRTTNDWIGRVLGVFTLTPYDVWRRSHAAHHARTGNLDQRGIGDITTLTVSEYLALPPRRRFAYRLYRHPIVMFGIGPAYVFLLRNRIPLAAERTGTTPWISAMATNIGIVALFALLIAAVGLKAFALVHVPIVLLGASMGVWLFYVQHQFEDTYWEHAKSWSHQDAAIHGSSHYDLPQPLRWLTANIGVHHVHHLSSRIPFYRLQTVLKDNPELARVGRISIAESVKTVRLKLWDEEKQKLVSFREAGQPVAGRI